MKKITHHASVFWNEKFIRISTQAIGMIIVGDPLVEPQYLAHDVDDVMLGTTLRQCLQKSRQIEMTDFQKMFKAGVFNQLDEERSQAAMQKYGYKTKRALYKNMLCCWISVFDGKIEIKPTHHKALDAYSGISNDGPEIQHLPVTCSDAELGAALREGFKHCTSAVT